MSEAAPPDHPPSRPADHDAPAVTEDPAPVADGTTHCAHRTPGSESRTSTPQPGTSTETGQPPTATGDTLPGTHHPEHAPGTATHPHLGAADDDASLAGSPGNAAGAPQDSNSHGGGSGSGQPDPAPVRAPGDSVSAASATVTESGTDATDAPDAAGRTSFPATAAIDTEAFGPAAELAARQPHDQKPAARSAVPGTGSRTARTDTADHARAGSTGENDTAATRSESPESNDAPAAHSPAREAERAAAGSVPGGPAARRRGRRSRVTIAFVVSIALLVGLALASAAIGQVPTTPLEVAGTVLHQIGLGWGPLPHHPAGQVTLLEVRFPRVVLALLVGAALATAGALLQGVFANPLAEPGVIGVSAGAAVGAGVVIVVGGAFAAAWSVAAGAFVAGLGTTLLVYLLSRSGGRTETVTLVLTGVAVNAFAGGLMAFLLFTASNAARDQIVFWQLGSLNGATWQSVAVVAPLTALGVLAAILMAPRLDLLALGEAAARHLGVDVERLRRNVILVVAVLATAGVAFTGVILFVGLIVPHVVRMLVGPAHRVLIPLSAILGAVVLLAADIGARDLVTNADLPLGMLTSLVGGPFFFWLLRRTRARAGGWA